MVQCITSQLYAQHIHAHLHWMLIASSAENKHNPHMARHGILGNMLAVPSGGHTRMKGNYWHKLLFTNMYQLYLDDTRIHVF